MRRLLLILAAIALVGAVALALGYQFAGLILLGAGVGGIVGEFIQSKFFLPRAARKIHRQHAALRANYTYTWDQDGVSASSETVQATRPWSDYIKTVEDERYFLLYHSDIMFEILPKTWFASPEQLGEFRALAMRVGT